MGWGVQNNFFFLNLIQDIVWSGIMFLMVLIPGSISLRYVDVYNLTNSSYTELRSYAAAAVSEGK